MTGIDQPKFCNVWLSVKRKAANRLRITDDKKELSVIRHPSSVYGFTLIELSIVLVIIGLIVGGVLTGRDLIRAAEIRSITADVEKFKTAVNTFKLKYNAIPGDMENAQTFWGAAADCTSSQAASTATCNGTGNGLLDNPNPSGTVGNEYFLFWKHLANAGLVAGNFTGIKDGTTTQSTTTNNSPSGKIDGSLWFATNYGIKNGNAAIFDGVYNNIFEYGVYYANADPINSAITPAEALALDKKIDDGKPGTGMIISRVLPLSGTCALKADGITAATNSDFNTAVYNSNSTGNQCVLYFPNAF